MTTGEGWGPRSASHPDSAPGEQDPDCVRVYASRVGATPGMPGTTPTMQGSRTSACVHGCCRPEGWSATGSNPSPILVPVPVPLTAGGEGIAAGAQRLCTHQHAVDELEPVAANRAQGNRLACEVRMSNEDLWCETMCVGTGATKRPQVR